jgi:hypothetical protein
VEQLLAAAGAIILGGGGLSLIAFGIFKWLGEKCLTSKFEEKLAPYKHAQQKELEQLRFRINSLMDRTTKLHQREFDIVPEAWSLLVEAHNTVLSLVASLQQYPDVNRMNASQLDEFVKDSFLTEWQKNELKLAPDKLKYYQKALFWHRLGKGKAACRDEHVHLLKNGIFMSDDLECEIQEG